VLIVTPVLVITKRETLESWLYKTKLSSGEERRKQGKYKITKPKDRATVMEHSLHMLFQKPRAITKLIITITFQNSADLNIKMAPKKTPDLSDRRHSQKTPQIRFYAH